MLLPAFRCLWHFPLVGVRVSALIHNKLAWGYFPRWFPGAWLGAYFRKAGKALVSECALVSKKCCWALVSNKSLVTRIAEIAEKAHTLDRSP
jgi:hypothetical protein